ncbi:DEAD/DEAH box helicase family protein [Streptomyces sp. ID05-39B]|uniref:DEAD/DEAH box helicase family protein n=1 Tax=Streptomyces sp. ID05-39B TaxID=3028664 RepID=UPI0029BED22D|nr:DEAD/DEAH box helicase family protein [Streptomyces sp. ID05-39B]MDX3525996.1 DEAD/DEAH box helicase family protein [Streptomyces sp. ID05-39B]
MAGVSDQSRDRRRSFNSAERVALFLAAGGCCVNCGVELEPGWHGDHMAPWSKGGPTDVLNGQALCPQCNLQKGSNSMTNSSGLRDWQRDARERYHSRNGGVNGNFLVVATPGAGKTTLALAIAQDLIDRSVVTRIVVIVPTKHLRRQWAEAGARRGIKLDHVFENRNGAVGADFDGVVATYQGVASSPLLWQRLTGSKRTLVIFDEIHHAGDGEDLRWGEALKESFEPAARRLLLSGTPFRTDGKPIPFVTYDEERRAVAGFNYDYGTALIDGGVVRPAVFPAWDGKSKWRRSGQLAVTSVDLSEADKDEVPPALKAALDPNEEWIPSVLQEAHTALLQMRIDTPDAGGLVVASDQFAANAYAKILERIAGVPIPVAISDEPNASQIIKDFSKGTAPWVVAVYMIAEGVDIPRLGVGVYASRVRTKMFFTQVVGRFVRMRGEDDPTTARVFIPSLPIFLAHAQDIEKTVDAALAEQEKKIREGQSSDGESDSGTLFPAYEIVGSSDATHHATIASGSKFTPEQLAYAQRTMEMSGPAPASVTSEWVASLLSSAGAFNPQSMPPQRVVDDSEPLGDQKKTLRKLIHRKVGRLAALTNRPYQHINGELNQSLQNNVTTATLEQLQKRLVTVEAAIRVEQAK